MTDVHETAVVSPRAELADGVAVGPYCVVGPHVAIGAGTRLQSHVVVDGRTTIGEQCLLFPFACIGTRTQDLKYRGGQTFVRIGDRTTLREYVTVNSGTRDGESTTVGSDCLIMAYAHVAHACAIGNEVIMANGATLAGEVVVEDQAVVGGQVGIHQFCRVGRLCMLGGCTKVVQDCPPFMMVDGYPARVRGINSVGMQRRGLDGEVQAKMKQAYRLLYRRDLSVPEALERIRRELAGCEEVDALADFVASSERGIVR